MRKYSVDDILAIIQTEFERLKIVIKGQVGSGTAYQAVDFRFRGRQCKAKTGEKAQFTGRK